MEEGKSSPLKETFFQFSTPPHPLHRATLKALSVTFCCPTPNRSLFPTDLHLRLSNSNSQMLQSNSL